MTRPIPDEEGRIATEVKVSLSDVIRYDLEGFLDLISELSGYPLLMDQSYSVVRIEDDGQTLVLKVEGDASADID